MNTHYITLLAKNSCHLLQISFRILQHCRMSSDMRKEGIEVVCLIWNFSRNHNHWSRKLHSFCGIKLCPYLTTCLKGLVGTLCLIKWKSTLHPRCSVQYKWGWIGYVSWSGFPFPSLLLALAGQSNGPTTAVSIGFRLCRLYKCVVVVGGGGGWWVESEVKASAFLLGPPRYNSEPQVENGCPQTALTKPND